MKIRRLGPFTATTRGSYCALELDVHLPLGWVFTVQAGGQDERLALELWNGERLGVSHRLAVLAK